MTGQIVLSCGAVTLVDDDIAAEFGHLKWNLHPGNRTDYVSRQVYLPGRRCLRFKLHRVILDALPGQQVDHRDGDGLNNQRANLRAATIFQNASNKRKLEGFTSRFKGVSWSKTNGRWKVQIQHNNKNHHVGYFDDPIQGALAYDAQALSRFGEFACTNESMGLLPPESEK